MALEQKHILLIVTGGIAAYKMNQLVRDLIKRNAEVKVIMTPAAKDFVSPLTLSTLSKNPVYSEFATTDGEWNNHVELALWADLVVVSPCTAGTLAKMVYGICDNLAIATYMSAKCPVMIAPTMDLDMYAHPSTKQNLELATDYGHIIIPAQYGELASGLYGEGRLAEVETIVTYIEEFFGHKSEKSLQGKTVLITAGPTYEAIDPVRFIGNHSSGKMGFSLAEEAIERGASVVLISGPSALNLEHENLTLIRVQSAREMYNEVFKYYDSVDIAIASAAVADYSPKEVQSQKIKKSEDELTIELVKNPDILRTMGEQKKAQILVGFALETNNEVENAKDKLTRKNLDAIVLNSLRDPGAGFKNETNQVTIISASEQKSYSLKSKRKVASDIFDFISTIVG